MVWSVEHPVQPGIWLQPPKVSAVGCCNCRRWRSFWCLCLDGENARNERICGEQEVFWILFIHFSSTFHPCIQLKWTHLAYLSILCMVRLKGSFVLRCTSILCNLCNRKFVWSRTGWRRWRFLQLSYNGFRSILGTPFFLQACFRVILDNFFHGVFQERISLG